MAKKQFAVGDREETSVSYVGPTIPKIAQSNTVYKNGIPHPLEAWMHQHPVFRSLLVPVKGIAEVRREIGRLGSEKNLVYREAEKIIEGGQ